MNWVSWVLFAACLTAAFGIGWVSRGYYHELREDRP